MWSAPRPGIGPERSAPARPPHRRHHGLQDLHPGISWCRCGRLQSTGVPILRARDGFSRAYRETQRAVGIRVRGITKQCDRDEHAGALAFDDANPENHAVLPLRIQHLQRLDRAIDDISVDTYALDGRKLAIGAGRVPLTGVGDPCGTWRRLTAVMIASMIVNMTFLTSRVLSSDSIPQKVIY